MNFFLGKNASISGQIAFLSASKLSIKTVTTKHKFNIGSMRTLFLIFIYALICLFQTLIRYHCRLFNPIYIRAIALLNGLIGVISKLLHCNVLQAVMLLSCIMAFLINYCVFLNTTLNSALTQTICGNLKVRNICFQFQVTLPTSRHEACFNLDLGILILLFFFVEISALLLILNCKVSGFHLIVSSWI